MTLSNETRATGKTLGESLRQIRIEAGLEVAELASRTRIGARNIEALEEDRLDLLPGHFFVKGFIRSICGELGQNPDPFLEMAAGPQEEELDGEERGPGPRKALPLWLTAGVLLFLVLGGIWLYGNGGNQEPAPAQPEPLAARPEPAEPAPPDPAIEGTPAPVPVQEPLPVVAPEPPAPEEVEELDLAIRAIERTWLRIQTDASKPWETTLKTGDEVRLRAAEKITLFIGNAGGLLFELNGRNFGPPGSSGQVITSYVVTRDNL